LSILGETELSGFVDLGDFQNAHRQWVEQGHENGLAIRGDHWSEAIAVGSLTFVETVKNRLGMKATHREVIEADGRNLHTARTGCVLRAQFHR
jgi:hypothetical protein